MITQQRKVIKPEKQSNTKLGAFSISLQGKRIKISFECQ